MTGIFVTVLIPALKDFAVIIQEIPALVIAMKKIKVVM
jgi:hypothetical protein